MGLSSETYWYPLGYPALGASFYRLAPLHAFFFPNLILVVGTALLFYRIAREFVTAIEAVLFAALFLIFYRGTTALSLIEPWNTIPTIFLSYALILLVGLRAPERKLIFIGAACVGLIYLCRPPDAVCMGLILPFAILRLPRWKERLIVGSLAALGLLVCVAIIFLINHSVFGSWRTPYEVNSARIGFASYPLGERFFSLIIDARPVFELDDSALLVHFPWLILIPPGIVYFIRQRGWNALAVMGCIAATYLVYFCYNDFWPGNVFRYHLIHYLFWTLPLLALLTYVGFREAWKDRIGRWSLALILPLLAVTSLLTLKENVLWHASPDTTPNRATTPQHASNVDWILIDGKINTTDPFAGEFGLAAFQDFVRVGRNNGQLLLLAKRVRNRSMSLEETDPNIRVAGYGSLDWQLRWPPRPLPLMKPVESVRIVWQSTSGNLDVTGPLGAPDGRPDEVIDVALDANVWHRIAGWDIQTTDKRGHWVNYENSNGWWRIKVASLPATPSTRAHLQLIFPDYGDFERASAFTLRAKDISGTLVFEQTISK
jgi:hypothetical protein